MTDATSSSNQLSSWQQQREFFVSGENLWAWWQQARQQSIAHDISPLEADWLLLTLSNLEPLDLRLGTFQPWQQVALHLPLEQLTFLWQQRLEQRLPVQYLIGKAPWREFVLQVSTAVLIPRPETELLIDLAVASRQKVELVNGEQGMGGGEEQWADLGTGSGAIALGLATAFPDATIHAVDCSAAALAIAQANASTYRLNQRIKFHHGFWLEPLGHLKGKLSGIVSNPPYIPSQQVLELQPEVSRHEPHLALDGGSDGLDCIRHLVTTAPEYLRSNGTWLIEMMAGQAQTVAELLNQNGNYNQVEIHSDLAGIERFASARRR